jgi:hypothetical protein
MSTGELYSPVADMTIPLTVLNIVDVYFLAVKWDIRGAQNLAISLLFRKLVENIGEIPNALFEKIYHNTSLGSPLRGLFAEYVVNVWCFTIDERNRPHLTSDVLIDMINVLKNKKIVPGSTCRCTQLLWREAMNRHGLCHAYHRH